MCTIHYDLLINVGKVSWEMVPQMGVPIRSICCNEHFLIGASDTGIARKQFSFNCSPFEFYYQLHSFSKSHFRDIKLHFSLETANVVLST